MYLPFDEWRLLAGYYCTIHEIGRSQSFREGDVGKLLKWCRWSLKVPEQGQEPLPEWKRFRKLANWIAGRYVARGERVDAANRHLAERGLIKLDRNMPEQFSHTVTLTVDGFDLGRQYSCWLSRSGLWFAQYSQHWLWLAVAFIGGGVASKLIDVIIGRWNK